MLPGSVTLLDADMVFVTGKGGVGKTTVAAGIALAGARSGRRTVVCELAGQARIPSLLGARAGGPHEEVELGGGLWSTTIEPWRVLEEWIGTILHSRSLTSLLTRANVFRSFAEAAPGGMELGTIVKTWELAQHRRWDRRRHGYDLVVVDASASGHAIGLLRTPGTFSEIARVGPLASQAARVRDWLADPARTRYAAVAIPSELPVAETLQLDTRLRDGLGRGLDAIVVNGVLPDRFAGEEAALVASAARREGAEPDVASAVLGADSRAHEQAAQLERLHAKAAETGASCTELPFLFRDGLQRADVESLAGRLSVA
jgi:anion-transporting  ArsA/GET3 family ATPase